MNKEELLGLRERILAATVPLVLETAANGTEKFSLLVRIIHAGNASSEIYTKAYEAAQAIEDKDERLSALMDLLDEVELDVDSHEEPAGEAEAPEGAASDTQVDETPPTPTEDNQYS